MIGHKHLVVLMLIAISMIFTSGCTETQKKDISFTDTAKSANPDIAGNKKESLTAIPPEYAIYSDYIDTIGAKPKAGDIATIEATVISLTISDKCPSVSGESCNIEPYPDDWAVIKIDKITNYMPYIEQTAEQPADAPDAVPAGNGETTPPNEGMDLPKLKIPEFKLLEEGQNASAHFMLTARPAKIRYMPISTGKSEGGSAESSQTDATSNNDAGHTLEQGKHVFKPIPKDGNYFVFTTKIGEYADIVEKILPGLKTGDRLIADISYDGTVYIEEYKKRA